jgi:hypothetical protein
MQHQVSGVKLDVAMLNVDMFSTRTDLCCLPSPRVWKVSISAIEVGQPPPPPQDCWLIFELPVNSNEFTALRRRNGGVGILYDAARSGGGKNS